MPRLKHHSLQAEVPSIHQLNKIDMLTMPAILQLPHNTPTTLMETSMTKMGAVAALENA